MFSYCNETIVKTAGTNQGFMKKWCNVKDSCM